MAEEIIIEEKLENLYPLAFGRITTKEGIYRVYQEIMKEGVPLVFWGPIPSVKDGGRGGGVVEVMIAIEVMSEYDDNLKYEKILIEKYVTILI